MGGYSRNIGSHDPGETLGCCKLVADVHRNRSHRGATTTATGALPSGRGMGGTAGAIITCPLEVVKTRLQATDSGFGSNPPPPSKSETLSSKKAAVGSTTNTSTSGSIRNSIFHPEVARGHMQITVPVASMHSKASISSTPVRWSSTAAMPPPPGAGGSMGVAQCLKHIFMHEGIPGLFKGLGPNLMGVFPRYAGYHLILT